MMSLLPACLVLRMLALPVRGPVGRSLVYPVILATKGRRHHIGWHISYFTVHSQLVLLSILFEDFLFSRILLEVSFQLLRL